MRFARIDERPRIEAIVNDPVLRVWSAFDGAPMANLARYFGAESKVITGDWGCFLLDSMGPGRYVVHTNLLPSCRGIHALRIAREALHKAFIETDAVELLTMVPDCVPQAKWLARSMGFRHQFDRRAIWPVNGVRHDMAFLSLSLGDWILAGECRPAGEAYHHRLHHELGAKSHDHDPTHDAYVGAAIEMILANNVHKGLETYNQWARFALYEPVRLVSENPLLIDIKQCILRVEGDQFYMENQNA